MTFKITHNGTWDKFQVHCLIPWTFPYKPRDAVGFAHAALHADAGISKDVLQVENAQR